MKHAEVPPALAEGGFCPVCGQPMREAASVDPYAVCLACDHGHRFFIMPEGPDVDVSSVAARARFGGIEGGSPRDVATFWLTDPRARGVLPQQLAELLRVVIEGRAAADEPAFACCPVCAGKLVRHEQTDVWLVALRCLNGHYCAYRGSALFGTHGSEFTLHRELSDRAVTTLVVRWLEADGLLAANLPEPVRRALAASRWGRAGHR